MKKLRILVFPCGSEIGLEIHRSLKYSAHIELFGANSIDDHGRFVYKNYFGGAPTIDDENVILYLARLVTKYNFDAIYPTMDKVIWKLKANESALGCKVIASNYTTTEICLSKSRTYQELNNSIRVPLVYKSINEISKYPVFLKPDIGYGSRGVFKVDTKVDAEYYFAKNPNLVITEYLPGKEYTVDCFSDFKGKLLFIGPRERKRILNGISVNTKTMPINERIKNIAEAINSKLKLNGAWFFQIKESNQGELVLLEVAARLGGSSALYRAKGINFAGLSVFNAFEMPLTLIENVFDIEMDRALDNVFKIEIEFNHVYIDFDGCLIIDGKVNYRLIAFLYYCINNGKRVVLVTNQETNINTRLTKLRLNNIFDEIINLSTIENKPDNLFPIDAIFISSAHNLLKKINAEYNIPVFNTDIFEALY